MPPTRAARLDSTRAAALLALALVASFTLAKLAVSSWDFSAFVVAGDRLVDPAAAPPELAVVPDSYGYDGQFFYRLALDPFTTEETAYGITLDNPPYRQQRIGLAVVVWALTSAAPLPVSVALVLVNGLAVVAAAWLGARLARRWGRHALWGLLAGLSPGVVAGFARDLSEPLTWMLLLAGLTLWLDRRHGWATLAFCGAVLCRETTLVVLGGIGIALLVTGLRDPARRRDVGRAALLLIPLAVALAWQYRLSTVWGTYPVASTRGIDPGIRFFGIFAHLFDGLGRMSPLKDGVLRQIWVVERLWLLGFYVAVAWSLRRTALAIPLRAGWVLGGLLGMSVTAWARDMQFLRAANEAIAMGVLVLLATPGRLADRALWATAAVSLVVATVHSVL